MSSNNLARPAALIAIVTAGISVIAATAAPGRSATGRSGDAPPVFERTPSPYSPAVLDDDHGSRSQASPGAASSGRRAPTRREGSGSSAVRCSARAFARPFGLAGNGVAAVGAASTAPPNCPSQCSAHLAIIGCDERHQGPTTSTIGKLPYRHVGRFSGPGIPGCTGTLISERHVLTAAHCALDVDNKFREGQIQFRLGQYAANGGSPYGVAYGDRVFVPKNYKYSGSEQNKASDWAVVELTAPIAGAVPMDFGHALWSQLKNVASRTVGYPYDKPTGTVWYHHGSFLAHRSFAGDGGARGLLHVTNDGAGGQSGSPIYAFIAGQRRVVGVFIGSPESHCEQGRTWAARLTPYTTALINDAINFPSVVNFSLRWSDAPTED